MFLQTLDYFGMNLQNFKWDIRFLDLAKLVSTWSKDPSTKIGAVITDSDNKIISLGYNGFPKKLADDDRLNNRETKYKMIIHGEMNAILSANRSLEGCTLYTYPFMPCPRCASMVIQTGINRIVSYKNINERWAEEFELSLSLFKEANIEYTEYENEF
jgi:dCMP deaminase